MSSEIDKLIEAITEQVLAELAAVPASGVASAMVSAPAASPLVAPGVKLLVAPLAGRVEESMWVPLMQSSGLQKTCLVWSGFPPQRVSGELSAWSVESRSGDWSEVTAAYQGVVLLGADLETLASLTNFGAGGVSPASAAIAAIGSGTPVFVDSHRFEMLRRHSSRLASGFVARFEELYRLAGSFGIEFGGAAALEAFLSRLAGSKAVSRSPVADRSSGRAVVTVEDIESVRGSGETKLCVALGTIVTPLALQRASEWGIEVVFQ